MRDGIDNCGATGRGADPTTRRRVLAGVGALTTGLTAGCLGGDGTGTGEERTATDAMGGSTATGTGDGTTGTAPTTGTGMDSTDTTEADAMATTAGMAETATGDMAAWWSTDLSPVRSDGTFTIAGFDGPVVVETFAVWCPVCERQQEELPGVTDDATVVSLNVDPNEDVTAVEDHAVNQGFGWRFAVSPPEMTRSLVDQFGTTVTNPPAAPVVVACDDGSATMLSGEVNTASEITGELDEC